MRRQRRRRARGRRHDPQPARTSSPWTRTRWASPSATCARSPSSPARATPRSTSSPASARGSTPCARRAQGRSGSRWPRIEWLDPVFVAGPLDAADHRPGRRHRRARLPGRALRAEHLGDRGGRGARAWSSPCRAATTPSARTPRPRRTPTRCGPSAPSASWPSTPSAYFSRPGPRLVDGLELMAHILHPDLVPEPAGRGPRGRGLSPRTVLYLHSSSGRYGADRQLHAIVARAGPGALPGARRAARPRRRWRPTCARSGIEVLVRPLAVLRRSLMSPNGIGRRRRVVGGRRGRPGPRWRARAASRSCTPTRR